MPPKKSLTTLLKELNDKYGDLSKEDATQQISVERAQLHTHAEELKRQHGVAESKKKGAITVRRNHVEAKITALDKFLEMLSQPTPPNGTLPTGGTPSGPVPPPIKIPARAPSSNTPPPAPPAGGTSPRSVPPPIKIPARTPSSNPPPPATNEPPAPPTGGTPSGSVPPPPIKIPARAPSSNPPPPATNEPPAPPTGGTPLGSVPPLIKIPAGAPSSNPPPPATNEPPAPPTGGTTPGSAPPLIEIPDGAPSSNPIPLTPPTPKALPAGGAASGATPPPPPIKNTAGGTSSAPTPPVAGTLLPPQTLPIGPKSPATSAVGKPQRTLPRPRPIHRKERGLTDGSQSKPLVVDDDEVKPVIPPVVAINASMDKEADMKVLTAEQSQAMADILRDVAGEQAGPSSRKKRKNTSEEGKNKKTKADKQEKRGGGEPTARRKRNREELEQASQSVSKKPKLVGEETAGMAVVKGKGKGRKVEEDSELEDDGVKGGRKRAEKEPKTCWIFIIVPAIIQPGGATADARIRVLAPVDESETKRGKLNRQGWTEVHNYIVGGLNISCAVLSRTKQFRWYCREIGALSLMLIWSLFINRNKRTRCHFHAITDRASTHNDVHPKISKATREPAHIITGVGLPQDDTLLASASALGAWGGFKTKGCTTELAGARDSAERVPTTIGGMTKEDLLSFFRLVNGRHYLGCGCDLLHATFDFFLWKVAPPLFSGTVDGSVECIGTPWDVRFRPTLIAMFSSMGLSPDNLDTVMKYNIDGQKNDLSSAPQFVRDFWTLNGALKSAQWRKVGPSTPPPTRRRTNPGYIDPDDIQGGMMVSDSDSDSDSDSGLDLDRGKAPVPKAKMLRNLNLSESEEWEEEPNEPKKEDLSSGEERSGDHGVGNDGEKCGKEGTASTPMSFEKEVRGVLGL